MADKPFPWICGECGRTEVRPKAIDYKAEIKHDGKLREVHVENLEVPTCSHCGEQWFDTSTDEKVQHALREKIGLMQPEEIRSERKRLGLNQEQIAEYLGVAKESISRWENGAQIQSRSTDKLLRIFFRFNAVRNWLAGDEEPQESEASSASLKDVREQVVKLLESFSEKAMQISDSPDVFARILHPWKLGKSHLSLWHAMSAYVHDRDEDDVKELTYRVAIRGLRGFRRMKSELLAESIDASLPDSLLEASAPPAASNRVGDYFGLSRRHWMSREYSLESWLVGSMLLNPSKISQVVEFVKAEDFDEELTRELFEKTVDCFRNQNAYDTASMVKCLQATKMSKRELDFLSAVFGSIPSGERVIELAQMIRNKSMFRTLTLESS